MTILQKIFAVLICTIFTLPLMAQHKIGFRTGIVSGSVDAPSSIDGIMPNFKKIYGTNIALIGELGIADGFSIQPELSYTKKGFTIKEGLDLNLFNIELPVGVKAVTKVTYVEMPLLAKYKFGGEMVQAYVAAGPSFGYAASARLKTKAQFILDIPISNTDLNLDNIGYQRFEVGGVFAAGVNFNTRNGGAFIMEARFTRGFTDTYTIPVFDLDVRNQGFGFSVGYLFPLNGNGSYPGRA